MSEKSRAKPKAKSLIELRYPRPKAMGGRLIRRVIGLLREHGTRLPLASHILIGVSGGADSVALAHLLIHYGRRIVPRDQITLVHINHGWRGSESDGDEKFVRELAQKWKVELRCYRLKPSDAPEEGESWEAAARECRRKIFDRELASLSRKGKQALLFTAHQADDLAETLVWRLFTGSARSHGGGIAVRFKNALRPLLTTRKQELQAYLKEEAQSWREDSTNHGGRFLRARMRAELMPIVEWLFPRAVENLVQTGISAQKASGEWNETWTPPEILFGASGLRVRRDHWKIADSIARASGKGTGEVHLPGGWKLTYSRGGKKPRNPQEVRGEVWTLEKWPVAKNSRIS